MRDRRIITLLAIACMLIGRVSSGEAFPGATGFGSNTTGGLPTQSEPTRVIRVTTLDAEGPGSLKAALEAKGRRLIVFEIGGVIDLGGPGGVGRLRITNPHVTVAGQTAPGPGITIIKGDVLISTHDVLIRHIRVRPGDAGQPKKSGWAPDGISTGREGHDVVVDHCSVSWAVDENMTTGAHSNADPGTSNNVTFSNCISAEGLSHATHKKGEHSKGMLLMDGNRKISHIRNLLVSNVDRNPMVSAAEVVLANNFVQNFGSGRVIYARNGGHPSSQYVMDSEITAVANVVQAGPGSRRRNVYIWAHDSARDEPAGEKAVQACLLDNIFVERDGSKIRPIRGSYTLHKERLDWPDGLEALPADEVTGHVLTNAGATPWDRDEIDRRIIEDVRRNQGSFVDSQEEVGGYPDYEPVRRELNVPEEQDKLATWLQSFEKEPPTVTMPEPPMKPTTGQKLPEAKGRRITIEAAHDATISGMNPDDQSEINAGDAALLNARHCTEPVRNQKAYLRFDLVDVDRPIRSAHLRLHWSRMDRGGRPYAVYGLLEREKYGTDRLGEKWDEGVLTWDNAPANPTDTTSPAVDDKTTRLLGRLKSPGQPGDVVVGGERLTKYLLSDTNDTVTLIIVPIKDDATLGRFSSSETNNAPTLIIDGPPEE